MMRRKMMLFWREGDQEIEREKEREKVREKERDSLQWKKRESFLTKANFLFRWEKHLGSLGRIKRRSQSPISLQSEFRRGLPKI
jgi:hypothetical protein